MYAHYEDDWRVSPSDHLNGVNFNAAAGVEIVRDYIDKNTFLVP